MNKSDLIDALARKEALTENNASAVVNLVFDGFRDALRAGERVEIRGFGTLSVREYGAYMGRNPLTGEKIPVQAKRAPFFKVGKELKRRVNGATAPRRRKAD